MNKIKRITIASLSVVALWIFVGVALIKPEWIGWFLISILMIGISVAVFMSAYLNLKDKEDSE